MSQHAGRRRKTLALASLLAVLLSPLFAALRAQPSRPVVYSAVVDALIQPVSAEFMVETLDRAARERAELVVFTLRTPGGLLDSTRVIVQHILASKVPVAVFVGPAGSRAASAAFLVTSSADLAALAPGTHIGAAHPVEGSGEKLDPTMAKKMASDLAASARTWATGRFVRSMLGERGFASFLGRVLEVFADRFSDPVQDFRDVLIAVGTKPS